MRHAMAFSVLLFAAFLLPVHGIQAETGKVTRLSIFSDDWNCIYPPALEGNLCFTLNGTENLDETRLKLKIDGAPVDMTPRIIESSRLVVFPLLFGIGSHDDARDLNREMWSRLLGSPFATTQVITVPFDVEYAGRSIMAGTEEEPLAPSFRLLRYEDEWMLFGFGAALAVIACVLYIGLRSSALRNRSPVPQVAASDLPFCLGKLQMSVWFCLIFAAFVFIWAVTGQLKSLNPETFILLGISAGTSLAAVMVDQGKQSPAADVEARLSAMGIRDARDAARLKALVRSGKGGHDAGRHFDIPPVEDGGQGEAAGITLSELHRRYLDLTGPYRSKGFIRDLINDAAGATVHRFQMLAWTAILGMIYIFRVYWDLQMPQFGTNLLALMGISGGIYLGFKVPER